MRLRTQKNSEWSRASCSRNSSTSRLISSSSSRTDAFSRCFRHRHAADRKGDNLYTCSVLALDSNTGKIKWYYQFSPNDPFDYDAVAEMVLATINYNGAPIKVLMHADKNGFFYVPPALRRRRGVPVK